MGFSLEEFFQELEQILAHKFWDDEYKVQRLEELVESARKYADECGEI